MLWVRKVSRLAWVLGVAAAVAVGVAGCASPEQATRPEIAVPAAYVLHPAGEQTVAYLDIRDTGAADQLLSVSTSVGGTVTFRAPERDGVTPIVMHTVSSIPVAADAITQLVPNSYHLLITGAGPMQDGKDITLQLRFAHAGTITILALVTNPATGGAGYFFN